MEIGSDAGAVNASSRDAGSCIAERLQTLEVCASGAQRRSGPCEIRVRKSARLVAFGCVAAIVVLSLLPGTERPHTDLPKQAEHFLAYAGTGFFLALGYRGWRQRVIAWLVLAAASCCFEILQGFVPGRSPSVFDALASSVGLAAGLAGGGALVALRLRDPRRP